MHDGLGVADHLPAGFQQFDNFRLRAEHGFAGKLGVGREGGLRADDFGGIRQNPAVSTDDGAVGEVELAPPDHVGHVAEGADHRDA